MKKFLIIFISFSFLIGFAVFFVTKTLAHNQRVYDVYYELAQEAADEFDFDTFVSMQSLFYNKIYTLTTDDYVIDGYIVVGKDGDTYINQLGVFVVPINEITYASDIKDENDQTGLRIINQANNETFYEIYTDPIYDDAAVSFGLTLMDFYFYSVLIEEDIEAMIELYDYHGNLIISTEQPITYQNYPVLDEAFKEGMQPNDLNALLDVDTYVTPTIIKNMTIYTVVDIALGILLYLLVKKRKERIKTY